MNPSPPSQPSAMARRPVGAVRARSIHGTSATYANHHSDGAGNASAGSAPATTAMPPRHRRDASSRSARGPSRPHRSSPN